MKFDKQKFNQTKLNAKNHHIVGTKQNIFVNDVVPKNKNQIADAYSKAQSRYTNVKTSSFCMFWFQNDYSTS